MLNQHKDHLVYLARGPEAKEGDYTEGLGWLMKKGQSHPRSRTGGRDGSIGTQKLPEGTMPKPRSLYCAVLG